MEPEPTVLDSLRKAVEAMPDDVPLRLHLATMLLQAGQRDEAVRQLGAVLQRDPGNAQALGLLRDPGAGPAADSPVISPERAGSPAAPPVPHAIPASADAGKTPHYDWSQAEDELRDVLPAMFVGGGETEDSASAGIDEADAYDAEQAGLTLADVAGMTEVKQRLLAATNHPWDVDSALRRPGRFDRTLLVLPPDAAAREGVFRYHLKDRPVAGIDLARLAGQTDGYSGADIAHICETAAERALMDSVRLSEPRLIGPGDLEAAIGEVRPSLGAWFDTARNVALFANENGSYDDLAAYLRKRRLI